MLAKYFLGNDFALLTTLPDALYITKKADNCNLGTIHQKNKLEITKLKCILIFLMLSSDKTLHSPEQQYNDHVHQRWEELSRNLSQQDLDDLDLLAELTESLGLEEIDGREIRLALIEKDIRDARNERALLKLQLELDRVDLMSNQLDVDMENVKGIVQKLKDFNSTNSPDALDTIKLKLAEYQERLENDNVEEIDGKMREFDEYIEGMRKCGEALDELNECKEFFAGLPPNLTQAQRLVEKEQAELDDLLARRDRLLRERYPDLHRERRRK